MTLYLSERLRSPIPYYANAVQAMKVGNRNFNLCLKMMLICSQQADQLNLNAQNTFCFMELLKSFERSDLKWIMKSKNC